MATWHTPTTAAEAWDDAPDSTELKELLDIAKTAVLTYVHPKTPNEDGTIEPAWRRVQIEHARNVYRSMYTDQDGLNDIDGFGSPVRYRDLDASLRELLRPRRVFGGAVG